MAASAAAGGTPADVAPGRAKPAKPEAPNAEDNANLLSFLFFTYMSPFVKLGRTKTLEPEDMPAISHKDRAAPMYDTLSQYWAEEQRRPKPSLLRAMRRLLLSQIVWQFFLQLIFRSLNLVTPVLLEAVILFLQDPTADVSEGWILCAGMFLAPWLGSMCSAHMFHHAVRAWTHARSSVSTIVYRKSLKVRESTKDAEFSTGNIVNIMSSDSDKLGQMLLGYNDAMLVPLQIFVIVVLLEQAVGPAVFAGLAVMLVMLPLMVCVIMKIVAMERIRLGLSDERVKLQSEILQGIRIVKFYAWEHSFMSRISMTRDKELKLLLRQNLVRSCITLMFMLLPIFTSLATFGVYVALGNDMAAATVFKALALFNALRFPLIQLPSAASMIISGAVSLGRVQRFLKQEEIEAPDPSPMPEGIDIAFTDAVYAWESEDAAKRGAAKKQKSSAALVEEDATAAAAGEESEDEGPSEPALNGVNITCERGKLTAVVGRVGSGKTSLFGSLLGEMRRISGSARIASNRSKAYVAQEAWIQNMTVRENILFNRPYDRERYHAVVKATGLEQDLDALPGGDATEIGDRGINLSGGQKQRVALARAVYAQPDIVLLDDPLSAVDANVGQHIFMQCINGPALAGTTRLFVTNQLHLLPHCDHIYVIEDGKVKQSGSYVQLVDAGFDLEAVVAADDDSDSAEESGGEDEAAQIRAEIEAAAAEGTMSTNPEDIAVELDTVRRRSSSAAPPQTRGASRSVSRDRGASTSRSRSGSRIRSTSRARSKSRGRSKSRARASVTDDQKKHARLTEDETREVGSVDTAVYKRHLRAMGGCSTGLLMFLTIAVTQAAIVFSDYWLAYWTQRSVPFGMSSEDTSDGFFMAGYVWIAVVAGLALLSRGLVFAVGSYKASRSHHDGLLRSVMRAPATFFDQTPTGRVLNRFAKDIDSIDTVLPNVLENFLTVGIIVLGSLLAVSFATPLYLLVVLAVVFVLTIVQSQYKPAAIGMQRIESTTRSPLYSHFTETLQGVSTVRAFGMEKLFQQENEARVDRNVQAFFLMRLCFRWATLRIELLNAVSAFCAAALVVAAKDTLDPSFAGAALNFSTSIGGILGFLIILSAETEVKMNSVERVREYSVGIKPEAPWENPDHEPAGDWPSKGEIEFRNVEMAYRPDLEPALRGFSVKIPGGHKCGVVGRTGSGKSTTMLTLFRMYEIQRGDIIIDGEDISQLGLHTLRRGLAIIPQDPVCFSGTIRDNLDPFNEHTDAEIWEALTRIELKTFVESQDKQLQHPVEEFGSNLSLGQRQLICMGRALLRRPKILVMDEATSSVDQRTDDLIQAMVRTHFADCTVLAIAHRLNTIMDSDAILVLDAGKLKEHGTADELTAAGGIFADLRTASGH